MTSADSLRLPFSPEEFRLDGGALRTLLSDAELPPPSELLPIRQEASHRRYFRLRFSSPQMRLRGLSEAILCHDLPIPSPHSDDFIVLDRHLLRNGFPAPEIFALHAQSGLLLLEDGGTEEWSGRFAHYTETKNREGREELLKGAVDLLLKLHRISPPPPVRRRFFDYEKLRWELSFLYEKALLPLGKEKRDSLFTGEIQNLFDRLCRRLDHLRPFVFTHRDFHGRNILIREEGKKGEPNRGNEEKTDGIKTQEGGIHLTVVDFQDARLGLPWYDLASLLYDPYSPLTPDDREQWFGYYVKESGLNPKESKEAFHLQAGQRLLKALGSYLFLSYEKEIKQYLPSIPAALKLLSEVKESESFFKPLAPLLEELPGMLRNAASTP